MSFPWNKNKTKSFMTIELMDLRSKYDLEIQNLMNLDHKDFHMTSEEIKQAKVLKEIKQAKEALKAKAIEDLRSYNPSNLDDLLKMWSIEKETTRQTLQNIGGFNMDTSAGLLPVDHKTLQDIQNWTEKNGEILDNMFYSEKTGLIKTAQLNINDGVTASSRTRAAWNATKETCKKVWEHPTGKTAVIVSGVLAGYAIVSAIVRATAGEQVTENRRVMPFTETSLGTYDKDIDDHLKLITATISLQLEKLCDTEGADMSWESLQAILAQCPVLEPDQERVYGEETYSGKFSKVDVNTWLYDFINKHDSDVRDAARIHDQEICQVIKFVGDQAVGFNFFSKAVSKSTDLLDIGMIRFPTKTDPCVKLYRLQLRGTFVGERFMMIFTKEDRSLTASVSSRKYYPRKELLQRIQPDAIKNTIEKFESML